MNNQTQNIQPDFGFITSQPSNEPVKKTNKKLLLIIVLLGLLVIVLVASFAFSVNDKVATNTGSGEAISSFMSGMSKSGTSPEVEVYPLLESNLTNNKTFAYTSIQRLWLSVDFSSCKLDGSIASTDTGKQAQYTCSTRDGDNVNLKISSNKQDKITAYRVI